MPPQFYPEPKFLASDSKSIKEGVDVRVIVRGIDKAKTNATLSASVADAEEERLKSQKNTASKGVNSRSIHYPTGAGQGYVYIHIAHKHIYWIDELKRRYPYLG